MEMQNRSGVMGASGQYPRTARAQYHLRQMFVFLNMLPLNQPEVMIANAAKKFDEQGNLRDLTTSKKIKELLEALVDWTRRLKRRWPDMRRGNRY